MSTPSQEELADLLQEVKSIRNNIIMNNLFATGTSAALGAMLGLGIVNSDSVQSVLSGIGIPVTGVVALLINDKITYNPLIDVENRLSQITGLGVDLIVSYEVLVRAEEIATKEFVKKTIRNKEYDIRYLPAHKSEGKPHSNMTVEEYINYCKIVNRMNLAGYTSAQFYNEHRIAGLEDLIKLRMASNESQEEFVATITGLVDGWNKYNSFNDYIIHKYNLNKNPKVEQYRIHKLVKELKKSSPTPPIVDKDLVERNTLHINNDEIMEK